MSVSKIYDRLLDSEHPDALTDDYIAILWARAEQIAAQQSMYQTAFGVLAVVFFLGFSCGAVVINGICGGW